MELVYLWVENYKNIHKQGFNFSPKYTCNYDEKSNELTIDENDDYIENFFGDNINVTAIVGKNGSGKSTIFEIISDWNYETILIYIENNQLYYYDLHVNASIIYLSEINKKEYKKDNFLCLNIYNKYEYRNFKSCINIETTQKESVKNYFKIYKILNQKIKNTNIPNFIYPEYINLSINKNYFTVQKDKLQIYTRKSNIFKKFYYLLIEENSNYFDIERQFVIFLLAELVSIKEYKYKYKDYAYLKNALFNLDKDSIRYLENMIKSYSKDFDFSMDEYLMIINSNLLNIKNIVNIHGTSLKKLEEKKLDKVIFKYINFFDFNFFDKNSLRSYENLSNGEKTLFSQFINLFTAIYNNKQKEYILFLDEPDNTLHPQWQKEYIYLMIKFLKVNFNDKTFHCIVTTHSPFLLSDIPKQNIIFLDTYEDGKCKVLKYDEVMNKKQTFGANIHTLLSDSFFMDDGLMGEFAKGKINEIIELHKIVAKEKHKKCLKKIYNKRKKNLWQTQSIIGEEYLKQVIKNHLVEIEKILLGKDMAKKEEIARTEVYLESLKNA